MKTNSKFNVDEVVNNKSFSKSRKIRILHSEKYTHTQIKDLLQIRYQFVYNVIKREKDRVLIESIEKDTK